MAEEKKQSGSHAPGDPVDIPSLVRHVLEEFVRTEHTKTEPAYKAELQEERKRREQLERRLNELVEENKRSQKMAEEADRNASIRAELQRLGVGKVDLAFKAVKDDIARTGDGRLIGKSDTGELSMKEFLAGFVNANPEFLPARISGGSGIPSTQKSTPAGTAPIDIEKIGPGMTAEEREQARLEIARIASQALRGA
jgi:hypothetical protein